MDTKFGCLLIFLTLFFSCSNENEKIIFVADSMVNCTGVSPQKCLQIKENENQDWTNFYDPIEGFDYEEGYSYKLKVEVSEIENPPADGSSKKYTLLEVLEKTKAQVSLAKGSWMVIKIKDKTSFERNPTLSLTMPQGQITGSTSCNKYFGNVNLENSGFKVNSIGTTRMACKDMETEQLFLEALNEVTSYKIENNQLQLLSADKSLLIVCDYLTERE